MIILQLILNFIVWLKKLTLNKTTRIQKSWGVEKAAMNAVPWDSGDALTCLCCDLIFYQGCFLYFANDLVIGSVSMTPFNPLVSL